MFIFEPFTTLVDSYHNQLKNNIFNLDYQYISNSTKKKTHLVEKESNKKKIFAKFIKLLLIKG